MKYFLLVLSFLAMIGCVDTQVATTPSNNHAPLTIPDRNDPNLRPTPFPTPISTPIPVLPVSNSGNQSVNVQPPASTILRNYVKGPGVNVAIVGSVGAPCQAPRPAVPMGGAFYDSCANGLWIMAHPPYFGAMNSWSVGTQASYFDGAGTEHIYRITGIMDGLVAGTLPAVPPGPVHFQVCAQNVPGSPIRVLAATPA